MKKTNLVLFISYVFMSYFWTTAGVASNKNNDESENNKIVGSWLSKVSMGGNEYRLLFNFNRDDVGKLNGSFDNVDNDKMRDIKLDHVTINNNQVKFALSAAQISFTGNYNQQENIIQGVWKEGMHSFAMTLSYSEVALDSIPARDYLKPVKINGFTLTVQKQTDNFIIFSSVEDLTIIAEITNELESNLQKITKRLKTKFNNKVRVYIYPNLTTFHQAINLPDAPDWFVGAAGVNELKIVSPLNPGEKHTHASLIKAVVHELVHVAVLNVRGGKSLIGFPNWLNEGYAYYEANQLTSVMRDNIKLNIANGAAPSWDELENSDAQQFGEMQGYQYSAMMIEFLISQHGYKNLLLLIDTPEDMTSIYGMSKQALEKQWLKYLQTDN